MGRAGLSCGNWDSEASRLGSEAHEDNQSEGGTSTPMAGLGEPGGPVTLSVYQQQRRHTWVGRGPWGYCSK